MKPLLKITFCVFSIILAHGCGGGGDSAIAPPQAGSPVTGQLPPVVAPPTQNTPAPTAPVVTQPPPATPPAETPNTVTFVSPLISTGDRIGTAAISQDAVNKLSASIATLAEAEKSSDSTQYPIAGNQWFLTFTSYTKNSPELASFGYPDAITNTSTVKIVVARFRSPTAARLFPCLFGDKPLDLAGGECNFASVAPGAWEGSTLPGGLRTRPIYLRGGPSIQQEISY
jgi:hypothetical protein